MNAEAAALMPETELNTEASGHQYLTFVLAGEEYGVDILRVQEIRGWETCTDLPNTPDYVRGVMNLRGTIVPIVDLRRRLGLPDCEYTSTTVVVVLKLTGRRGDKTVGFVVDAVSEVYNVAAEDLRSAPELGDRPNAGYIRHLATVGEKMLILLEADRLVDDDSLNQDFE